MWTACEYFSFHALALIGSLVYDSSMRLDWDMILWQPAPPGGVSPVAWPRHDHWQKYDSIAAQMRGLAEGLNCFYDYTVNSGPSLVYNPVPQL